MMHGDGATRDSVPVGQAAPVPGPGHFLEHAMRLSGLARRFSLVRAYVSGGRSSVPLREFVTHGLLRLPCTVIGPRYIESVHKEPDDLVVKFRDAATPLRWPREHALFDLHKVATETFDPGDWHFYEVPETTVRSGDTVLDCGAAEGIFALRVLGRAGRIALFEPLPSWAPVLRRTFEGHPEVEIVSVGLGDAEGRADLTDGVLRGAIVDAVGGSIPVTTVDRWVAQKGWRVDYIKADLEGFEHQMLQGAAETIRRDRPKIAITVYHPGNDWRWIVSFVGGLASGYRHRVKGISINGGVARPVMLHLWPEQPRDG